MQDFEQIKLYLRNFAKERDWEQFHSPKNLVMALSVEVSELMEHFQWLTEQQSASLQSETLQQVGEEIADVLLYLIRLSDQLNINLPETIKNKMAKNEQRYPPEKVKGSSKKYTEY